MVFAALSLEPRGYWLLRLPKLHNPGGSRKPPTYPYTYPHPHEHTYPPPHHPHLHTVMHAHSLSHPNLSYIICQRAPDGSTVWSSQLSASNPAGTGSYVCLNYTASGTGGRLVTDTKCQCLNGGVCQQVIGRTRKEVEDDWFAPFVQEGWRRQAVPVPVCGCARADVWMRVRNM